MTQDDEKTRMLSCDNRILHEQQRQQTPGLAKVKSSWNGLFQLLCWRWINPLLSLSYRQQPKETDLGDLAYNDKTIILLDRLDTYNWLSSKTWRIVIKEFWKDYLYACLIGFPYALTSIAQPLLLREIILQLMNDQESKPSGYVYAVLLCSTILIQTFSERQAIFYATRVGTRIRNALTILIFKRAFSVKSTTWQKLNSGYVMNLVANDVFEFEEACSHLSGLCHSLIEVVFILGLLCWLIRLLPTFCALALFSLTILLQMYVTRLFAQYREVKAIASDQRIQAFHELIHGFYAVKMHNWEKLMEERIKKLRENEEASIRRMLYLKALNYTQYFVGTSLFSLVTFGSAWLFGYPLTALNVFPVLLYFTVLRSDAMWYLPEAVRQLSEAKLSSDRIDSFMRLTIDDRYPSSSSALSSNEQQRRGSISMSDASFSWYEEELCLVSLNLAIERGTFVGIGGPVGAGKSSFLSAILGEMNLIHGQLQTNGSSFAYASQVPWIFTDTFRNNILLNRPFDEQRYLNVINACCLDLDLQLFGASDDLTIIGEKGVNLSGGQKARVAFARALYGDADVYLFDDPLAAVDPTVARQMYERCISPRGLLKDKTRLLVTHLTQFIHEADQIIFLSNGHIDRQGHSIDKVVREEMSKQQTSRRMSIFDEDKASINSTSIISDEIPLNDGASLSVWYQLLAAPPFEIIGLCVLVILFLLSQTLSDGTSYWLQIWLKRLESNGENATKFAYIYFGLILATVLATIVLIKYFFSLTLTGSSNLHNRMLKGLLYTSIQFFESNPSGRILNRASKDQHVIDEILPISLLFAISCLLITVGSMCLIFLSTPIFLLALVLFVPVLWILVRFYHRSSYRLKHLESITRSSVYALYITSLNGLSTIRCFRVKDSFIALVAAKMDTNTSAHLAVHATSQWLALRLTLLCSLFTLITSLKFVMFQHQQDPITAALSLTSALNIAYTLQNAFRRLSEARISMTSGERIAEYSHLIPEEDRGGKRGLLLTSSTWPINGNIEFRNYSLRHRSHLPYVIKNVNLHIKSGQKVGIIGRTGAGKSSLFKGLLRFIERSNVTGHILIDDVDISRITLAHLRSHLSVIPQQTILFSGTLRYNLDPFNHYSDEECWQALGYVQMKSFVSNHPSGLQMQIGESGSNLSVGQCQLLSIARAVLKKSKILLIDEATANVDQKTDELIQTLIHDKFSEHTVIIIAHRLNTVSRCDRILVLDQGAIVQDGLPSSVLS